MHANAEKTRQAIDEIRSMRGRISELLSDTPDFQTRAEHVFDTLANGLSFAIGDRPQATRKQAPAARPSGPRTIMGQPVPEISPIVEQIAAIQPTEGDLNKLREDVAKAYTAFPTLTNKEIRNTLSDLELRGVARKAGLHVTKTEPEHITEEFLNQVRQAIADKAAHDDAVLKAEQAAPPKPEPTKPNKGK
jgi:hypothetical protein